MKSVMAVDQWTSGSQDLLNRRAQVAHSLKRCKAGGGGLVLIFVVVSRKQCDFALLFSQFGAAAMIPAIARDWTTQIIVKDATRCKSNV